MPSFDPDLTLSSQAVRRVIALEAIALYESGLSLIQVGERLQVSSTTIRAVLAEAKVPRRPPRRARNRDGIADKVIKLYAEGLSTCAIGRQVGFSHTTISTILEEAGVPRRRPGPHGTSSR